MMIGWGIYVATMYIDRSISRQNNKVYVRYLLRKNYREGGKVKHRTIANLSHCSEEEINAIRLALKHKDNLEKLIRESGRYTTKQGASIGAVWVIYQMAKRQGIEEALGNTEEGQLALWQVIARVLSQGSRLRAVRLASLHGACDILRIGKGFNEDRLYDNLSWLEKQQERIEKRLFDLRHRGERPTLFLYDVTSSYLEGECNELGAYGYNRDKKNGKKQIVIGLLCDQEGEPVSVDVFSGNTKDASTFVKQIKKVVNRFGCKRVAFVGDRGMIKTTQIEKLNEESIYYITAITRPEIELRLNNGMFQMELFDQELAAVSYTHLTLPTN